MYETPTKTFDELADAWDAAVAEATKQLPPVASYPYDRIMIAIHPLQLDPISLYRNMKATLDHINIQDTYVTFRKVYLEGVVIGWERA